MSYKQIVNVGTQSSQLQPLCIIKCGNAKLLKLENKADQDGDTMKKQLWNHEFLQTIKVAIATYMHGLP